MLDVESPPEWIENYSGFEDDIPTKFLRSRVVFYPGAGDDLHPLRVFGIPAYAHYFIHCDYSGTSVDRLKDLLPGYEIYEHIKFDYKTVCLLLNLSALHPFPQRWTRFVGTKQINEGKSSWITFKRVPGKKDGRPEFLFLFNVFAEAVGLYWDLWAKQNTAPFAVFLQDHGMGLNWAEFGGSEAPLYSIAQKAALPPFLVVGGGRTRPWPNYHPIKAVGSGGNPIHDRILFGIENGS